MVEESCFVSPGIKSGKTTEFMWLLLRLLWTAFLSQDEKHPFQFVFLCMILIIIFPLHQPCTLPFKLCFSEVLVILKRLCVSEAEKCGVEIPGYLIHNHLLCHSAALVLISWDSPFMNQIKQLSAFAQGIKLTREQGRASISATQWCHSRYVHRQQLRSPSCAASCTFQLLSLLLH